MALSLSLAFASALAPLPAQAQTAPPLQVDVNGVGAQRLQLALGSFAADSSGITATLRADLERSGLFGLIDAGSGLSDSSALDPKWSSQGVDALAAGSVKISGSTVSITWRVWDTVQNRDLGGGTETTDLGSVRMGAHRVADAIIQKLTGKQGGFASRVAYVQHQGSKYRLMIADSDGESARVALTSDEPIISPSWSANGQDLAYVSYETRKPVVWVQNVQTGARRKVADFKGSNSAPAWSPDGSRLAVTLSRDGGSQIFLVNKTGGAPQRVTRSPTGTIDTEPTFSPDGASIYFVSDRGGSPQIYRQALGSDSAQRISFSGSYNISPAVSSDGRWLAYISRRGGAFRVMLQDLKTGQARALTAAGGNAQRPSFAPGGQLVLYSVRQGNRTVLMSSSLDGRVQTPLSSQSGSAGEPAWGASQ
ncbi:Tol-Pal system beta propeller repeat protein TolB [Amphibiibacter pelophylacis]|uniref:Tol-Pal system beta propeller repeat protein TolB n=1 Tax=Amphibiibacter pelophylacis TaxID=1799477 RepID=A0ACC6P4D9_9BURK